VGNTTEGCPVVCTCPNPAMQPMYRLQHCIGYNTVWSVLCECNEHNTRRTVL